MQRDAEVTPRCPLIPLVIRNQGIIWKGRVRPKREEEEIKEIRESDHGGLHHHLIITEQRPKSGRIPGQRDIPIMLKSTFTSKSHLRFNVRFNVGFNCLPCSCE